MTGNDAVEMWEWVQERWPRSAWQPGEAQALHGACATLDASDVWDALHRLYHKGLDFAPTSSKVAALAREVARGNALVRGSRGLPAPAGPRLSASEWLEAHGYEGWMDAVAAYAAGDKRCTGRSDCDRCLTRTGVPA
jgi:hypothetical protein